MEIYSFVYNLCKLFPIELYALQIKFYGQFGVHLLYGSIIPK